MAYIHVYENVRILSVFGHLEEKIMADTLLYRQFGDWHKG